MIQKLRARMANESGFTLVELLVVMLILGLLAAIAIPAFFNQREKAMDSDAKEAAHTAQVAIETYSTDNGGSYDGATADILVGLEETLSNVVDDDFLAVTSDEETYEITVTSETDNTFSIARDADGGLLFECTAEGEGGCPTGGSWSGDPAAPAAPPVTP